VVVTDGFRPFAQPLVQRLHEDLAGQWVLADLLPFLVRGLARLVEDLRADLELSDVV
jgi:hypothetical protein